MKLSHIASLVTVVTLALGLGGCAEDADASEAPAEVQVDVETDGVTPKYLPRVTKKDIIAGGGNCPSGGDLCTINHTQWLCSGGGSCTRVTAT